MSGPEKPLEWENEAPKDPEKPVPVDRENAVFAPDRAQVDQLLQGHEEALNTVANQAAASGVVPPTVFASSTESTPEKPLWEHVADWLSKIGDWVSENLAFLAPWIKDIQNALKAPIQTAPQVAVAAAKVAEAVDPAWKEKVLDPEAPVFTFLKGKNPKISSPFGHRDDPIDHGKEQNHQGIDITLGEGDTDLGEPIVITHSVRVLKAESTGASGNTVTVQDLQDPSITYVFRHLQALEVSESATLKEGALLGKIGNTGTRVRGAHLHFEVRKNGEAIDPQSYLGFN